MASNKNDSFANDFLLLVWNAVTWADIAENDTTSPATEYFISLHTADPTDSGNQESSEATFTSYARIAVARTAGGWTVTAAAVTNAADIEFVKCTGGSNVITHIQVGTLITGTGYVLYHGALSSSVTITTNDIFRIPAGDLDVTEE